MSGRVEIILAKFCSILSKVIDGRQGLSAEERETFHNNQPVVRHYLATLLGPEWHPLVQEQKVISSGYYPTGSPWHLVPCTIAPQQRPPALYFIR
jgi:hypothetical protein